MNAELFANKFEELYSSVSYSSEDLKDVNDELNVLVDKSGFADGCFSLL